MGIPIQNTYVYSLSFADDQVLLAQDHDDMEYMARKLKEECEKWGLVINLEKTKYAEIKHRISQTRKVINALNSVWWHKNITKNRKLYIYQTIIWSILLYGAEVWQIPTREINTILSTDMDMLRRLARKSRMERIKMNIQRK